MEGDKEEGRRAMDIAKRKLSESDYVGAKKFVVKAQNLYPELDGLRQILLMIEVFIGSRESDWYGILGVDPLADDETLKRQYKKLALLLHPDKNRIDGAEDAFKLVSEAWCLLSDKSKRLAYDQMRRSSKQVHQQPMSSNSGFESWFDQFQKEFADSVDTKEIMRSWHDAADVIAAAIAAAIVDAISAAVARGLERLFEMIKRWFEQLNVDAARYMNRKRRRVEEEDDI